MMSVMVKKADLNRIEVPEDYGVLDATEDHDAVQSGLLYYGVKGPGGFSCWDWYRSRAFNRLPPGPAVSRQTPQDIEAAYCPGCCQLSHRSNGEPNPSSEGVMYLWIMSLIPRVCSYMFGISFETSSYFAVSETWSVCMTGSITSSRSS